MAPNGAVQVLASYLHTLSHLTTKVQGLRRQDQAATYFMPEMHLYLQGKLWQAGMKFLNMMLKIEISDDGNFGKGMPRRRAPVIQMGSYLWSVLPGPTSSIILYLSTSSIEPHLS